MGRSQKAKATGWGPLPPAAQGDWLGSTSRTVPGEADTLGYPPPVAAAWNYFALEASSAVAESPQLSGPPGRPPGFWSGGSGPPGLERRQGALGRAGYGKRGRAQGASASELGWGCQVCHMHFEHPAELGVHEDSQQHRAAESAALLRERDKLEAPKQGVAVSQVFSPSWGCSALSLRESGFAVDAALILNCGYMAQQLLAVRFAQPPGHTFALQGLEGLPPEGGALPAPLVLPALGTASFQVTCRADSELGYLRSVLVLEFAGFKIGRWLEVLVEDPATRMLAPEAPYVPRPHPSPPAPTIHPGEAPAAKKSAKGPRSKRRCGEHPVPEGIRQALQENRPIEVLEEPLTVENYAARFAALLFVEEVQAEVDIRTYDMAGVQLNVAPDGLLRLEVPGLAEGRPTLVMGDIIHVSKARKDCAQEAPDEEFEGHIHQVGAGHVLLKFHAAFHSRFIRGERCSVRFSINTIPYRRAHTGLQQLECFPGPLAALVLPDHVPDTLASTQLPRVTPLARGLNAQQVAAVAQLLRRGALQQGPAPDCTLPPYVLFGPPGTGKTKTLVEAVHQILRAFPNAHILACAPSNSAADNLLERLAPTLPAGDMLRLNSVTRACPAALDRSLRAKFCRYEEATRVFLIPELRELKAPRVVISTCSTAVQLWKRGVARGHFAFILIDEAGHALEPECLLPAALLAGPATVLLLAGDPQQLGPVVRAPFAKEKNLGQSWLERLCNLPLYSPHPQTGYNPLVLTKLVKNYRSHAAILKLPSERFYCGELEASADPVLAEGLCRLSLLPALHFPLIFHGIQGQDMREGNSPSWFNPEEVAQVKKYITDLTRARVALRDIGVVTPYRRQMQKLRTLLDKHSMQDVKVGSVEEFQGQERRVIIISTVRSSQEFIEFDHRHCLGFLANPKRFNVAVTRTQQLLVCIGNPHVLAQDKHWGSLLKYCVDNGAYIGCPLPKLRGHLTAEQRASEERLLESLAALGLGGCFREEEEASDAFASWASNIGLYEDPPWPEPA